MVRIGNGPFGGVIDAVRCRPTPVHPVVAWYSAQITAERRVPVPDEDRTGELKAARQAAVEDQARLETAGPQEIARIAAVYAGRPHRGGHQRAGEPRDVVQLMASWGRACRSPRYRAKKAAPSCSV